MLSQHAKILKALKEAGNKGVPNYSFPHMQILKYSSRISELREEGHNIYCERQILNGRYTGVWYYFLADHEEANPKRTLQNRELSFEPTKKPSLLNRVLHKV